MEKGTTSKQIRTPQLEDVPDLIHCIQSLLPVEEAARTCVLSKSWLHAWSTIPRLRFYKPSRLVSEEQESDYMKLIDRTLLRYLQNNIPVETFDLELRIKNQELASLANKWIQTVATHRCLKELSLEICNVINSKFILPDEMFTGEKLDTIIVRVDDSSMIDSVWMTRNPVINCVSLQVLELHRVNISEEVLDTLLSTCTLLEKIDISYCRGLTTIKLKNLCYLQEFILVSESEKRCEILIADVPNLCYFWYMSLDVYQRIPITFNMDSLRSVTELSLQGVIIDVSFFDMIKSKLPFLEALDVAIYSWSMERLDIASVSLKRLYLLLFENREINIRVYAPKLLCLCCSVTTIHNLLFPDRNTPEEIKFRLMLLKPMDYFCVLKMREVLNLSSKFDIEIIYGNIYNHVAPVPLNIDIDDIKRRFPFPATNVHQLSFHIYLHEGLEHPSYFDALFKTFHPNYVHISDKYSSYFCKLLITGLMTRKTSDLKDIEFKNPCNGNWEILSNSWISTFGRSDDGLYSLELKLNWFSL